MDTGTHFNVACRRLVLFSAIVSLITLTASANPVLIHRTASSADNHASTFIDEDLDDWDILQDEVSDETEETTLFESPAQDYDSKSLEVHIEKVGNRLSVAYITKPQAELLIENGCSDIVADYVFISSEAYNEIKPIISASRIYVCSSEEELENVKNNIRAINEQTAKLGDSIQLEKFEWALAFSFKDDLPRKLHEEMLSKAVFEKDEPGSNSLKSLLTPSGIINASKYLFSKAYSLASFTAKSLITAPLMIPGIWMYQLIHHDVSSAIVLATIRTIMQERPDDTAVDMLALGPALFFTQLATSVPAMILGYHSSMLPILSLATSLLSYSAAASMCEGCAHKALSFLSNIKPLGYLGSLTTNLINKLYGSKAKEFVTNSEHARRTASMIAHLTDAADKAEYASLPYQIEKTAGSNVLSTTKRNMSLRRLSDGLEKKFSDHPDLPEVAAEILCPDVNNRDFDPQELNSEVTQHFLTYLDESLNTFKQKNHGNNLTNINNDQESASKNIASQKNALKIYLNEKVLSSQDAFEKYQSMPAAERISGVVAKKNKLKLLGMIIRSDELLQSLHSAHIGILQSNSNFKALNNQLCAELRRSYTSDNIDIDDATLKQNVAYLLSLSLPLEEIDVFKNEIIVIHNNYCAEIYAGLFDGIWASMDSSTIDLISDYYFSNFTNLIKDYDPEVLSKVLRGLLRGSNVRYVKEGFVVLPGGMPMQIQDFVNDYLKPRRNKLSLGFTKDEKEVFDRIFCLFDEASNDYEPLQKIRDMFCLLFEAHAAKPYQGALSEALSNIASFINYNNTSELLMICLTTLLSGIYSVTYAAGDLSNILLPLSIYGFNRYSGRSRSDSFFTVIPYLFVSEILNKLLRVNIRSYQDLVAPNVILSNVITPILNSHITKLLGSGFNTIRNFSNKISPESFVKMLNL